MVHWWFLNVFFSVAWIVLHWFIYDSLPLQGLLSGSILFFKVVFFMLFQCFYNGTSFLHEALNRRPNIYADG